MDMRERIRAAASARNKSIRALSLDAGLSDSWLHKYLTGSIHSPTVENLGKIADALGCSLQELMFGDLQSSSDRVDLRSRIREALSARDRSATEVSKSVGFSDTTLTKFLNGHTQTISFESLELIAAELDVPLRVLIFGAEGNDTSDVLSVWNQIPDDRKAQALTILSTFVGAEV